MTKEIRGYLNILAPNFMNTNAYACFECINLDSLFNQIPNSLINCFSVLQYKQIENFACFNYKKSSEKWRRICRNAF